MSLALPVAARADSHEFDGYIDSIALNVRSSPGTQSEVIGILLKYDPVTVTGSQNVGSTTWYSIKASGGYTSGWVSANFVKRGPAPESAMSGPVDYGAKETPTLAHGAFQYVGVKVCQECHEDAVGKYPQGAVGVWQSHFHSAAFKTLKKNYTKEIAKRARGVEDPATDWRCVKCHVTAFGAAPIQLGPDYNQEEGVGCEVCHGPGGSYAQEDHGPEVVNREAMGFRVLRDLDQRREVCTSCHNKTSPTYKPFDLRQFSRKIAHWVDPDDNAYRAEAGRESERRAKSVTMAAKGAAQTAGATAAGAAGAATKVTSDAKAEASRQAAQARAEAEAASRAARARAEAEASSRAEQAKAATSQAEAAARKAQADAAGSAAEARAAADAKAAAAKAAADRAAAEKAESLAAAKRESDQRARAAGDAAKRERAEQEARAAAAAAEAKQAAARAKAVVPAAPPAGKNPLAHFLSDVDDVISLNTDGVKYKKVKFPHKKHAGNDYLPGGDCQTCHHTQEGNDSPEACSECHNIGGDAEEDSAKKRYAHAKKKGYPKKKGQEEVSCSGCHKSMNAMLDAGKRKGDPAPTKCTTCHARK